jgi:hypothetical protein
LLGRHASFNVGITPVDGKSPWAGFQLYQGACSNRCSGRT